MSRPRMLLLDEPSMGLAPLIVRDILRAVAALRETDGTTVLLVEQNVHEALHIAHRAYVLQTGRIVLEGNGKDLLQSDMVRQAYLGM